MNYEFKTTACVTGHRPQHFGPAAFRRSAPVRERIRNVLRAAVGEAIERGYTTFISGMALGVDQDFAQVVLEWRSLVRGVGLVAAVPCIGQEKPWYPADQHYYHSLLDKADEVVIVTDALYKPWVMQVRNEWMVDRSNLIIAVWDGSHSGTGRCVQYALTSLPQREIYRIEPRTLMQ